MIEVYVDGSGPPQNFYCVLEKGKEPIFMPVQGDIQTNSIAEYMAMHHALTQYQGKKDVIIYTDSQFMQRQLLPENDESHYKVRTKHLEIWNHRCKTLMHTYPNLKIVWIPREQNLAGHVIEKKLGREVIGRR